MIFLRIGYSFAIVFVTFYALTSQTEANTDGLFGQYFQNIVSTKCSSNSLVGGFDTSPANYGKTQCIPFATYLGNYFGSLPNPPSGSAISGFDSGGRPIYTMGSSIWMTGTGGSIFYNSGNIGIGLRAPQYMIDVNGLIRGIGIISIGKNNQLTQSVIGNQSLDSIVRGFGNTSVGSSALKNLINGNNNTALGNMAGMNLTTGSNNIFIGFNTQTVGLTSISNQMNIGNIIYGSNLLGNGIGNIGIGVKNPTSKLDIGGDVKISGTLTFGGKLFTLPPICTGVGKALQWNGSSWICFGGSAPIFTPGPRTNTSSGQYFELSTQNVTSLSYDCTGRIGNQTYRKTGTPPLNMPRYFTTWSDLASYGWLQGSSVSCVWKYSGNGQSLEYTENFTMIPPNDGLLTVNVSDSRSGVVLCGDPSRNDFTSYPYDNGTTRFYKDPCVTQKGGKVWSTCSNGTWSTPVTVGNANSVTLVCASASSVPIFTPGPRTNTSSGQYFELSTQNVTSLSYDCTGRIGNQTYRKTGTPPLNMPRYFTTWSDLASYGWLQGSSVSCVWKYSGNGQSLEYTENFTMIPPNDGLLTVNVSDSRSGVVLCGDPSRNDFTSYPYDNGTTRFYKDPCVTQKGGKVWSTCSNGTWSTPVTVGNANSVTLVCASASSVPIFTPGPRTNTSSGQYFELSTQNVTSLSYDCTGRIGNQTYRKTGTPPLNMPRYFTTWSDLASYGWLQGSSVSCVWKYSGNGQSLEYTENFTMIPPNDGLLTVNVSDSRSGVVLCGDPSRNDFTSYPYDNGTTRFYKDPCVTQKGGKVWSTCSNGTWSTPVTVGNANSVTLVCASASSVPIFTPGPRTNTSSGQYFELSTQNVTSLSYDCTGRIGNQTYRKTGTPPLNMPRYFTTWSDLASYGWLQGSSVSCVWKYSGNGQSLEYTENFTMIPPNDGLLTVNVSDSRSGVVLCGDPSRNDFTSYPYDNGTTRFYKDPCVTQKGGKVWSTCSNGTWSTPVTVGNANSVTLVCASASSVPIFTPGPRTNTSSGQYFELSTQNVTSLSYDCTGRIGNQTYRKTGTPPLNMPRYFTTWSDLASYGWLQGSSVSCVWKYSGNGQSLEYTENFEIPQGINYN